MGQMTRRLQVSETYSTCLLLVVPEPISHEQVILDPLVAHVFDS